MMRAEGQPTPLISCIMPTAGRRAYLEQSITYFQAQDYPRKELIIIEDGPEMNGDLAQSDVLYQGYHFTPGHLSIGEKRNIACSLASGAIICHWDDDDYYGPQRLSRQAVPLLNGQADVSAMVMSVLYNTASETLWHCSYAEHKRLFVHNVRSGTLMYWARYWRYGVRYNERVRSEDVGFLLSLINRAHARLEAIHSPTSYVCIRHTDNTSDDMDYMHSPEWQQLDPSLVLPDDALAFYRRQKVRME